LKRSLVLGSLMCIVSIGPGYTQHNSLSSLHNLGSSVSIVTASVRGGRHPASSGKPGKPSAGGKARGSTTQSKDRPSWLLQPGLFRVLNGMWLGWIALAVGLFGIGSALIVKFQSDHDISQLNKRLSGHKEDIRKARADLTQLSLRGEEITARIDRLQSDYQQIENKHAAILASINSLRTQQKTDPQTYAIPIPSLISTPLVASQPYQLSPAKKQAELTAAVNRGDRQLVKSETIAHLNITHASENAISMGRLNETQLEEVSAGGSYWAASFGGETWLYPTEQTLRGYIQSQRPTGIFNYTRQSIPSAQVISPARLTLSGSLWQVAEIGTIAVPG